MSIFQPMLVAILAVTVLSSCASSQSRSPDRCLLGAAPNIVSQTGEPHEPGSSLLQSWTVGNSSELWREETPAAIETWQSIIRSSGVETDAVALLRSNDMPNNRLVASNAARWIRPIRCIEALALEQQNARIPLATASTEFALLVLTSPDEAQIRLHYFTRNFDGIGNVARLEPLLRADIASGWIFRAALHNHNFRPHDANTNGMLAPSVSDAALSVNWAAAYGLQEIWITNGIETVRIPASAFDSSRLRIENSSRPLPAPRQQLIDLVDRVISDACEHVRQPGLWVYIVELRRLDQRVHDRRWRQVSDSPIPDVGGSLQ